MGKTLDYILAEDTGRLVFRRTYPTALRPFVEGARRELKIPLGVRTFMTAEAFRTYERVKRQFEDDVKAARAAKQRHDKGLEGRWDALSPACVAHLAEVFTHEWHAYDEGALRSRGDDWADRARGAWDELLDDFRRWRVEGDLEALNEHWGKVADRLIAAEGLLVDPEDAAGRERLLWALNDAAIMLGEPAQERLVGRIVPVPPRPARPSNPRGGARTVSALIDAYRSDKWEGWGKSSRAATVPVFRLLNDAIGSRPASSITRDDAREVLRMVQALPVNLGKQQALKDLPVPEAIERGKALGLATIGPRTINQAYMIHISAIWNFAVREDWVPKNVFQGLGVADPVAARDKRDPFTTEQLQALFSQAPWDAPAAPTMEKPGAFWVPPIALFMGARLAEITGLRIMDVEDIDGLPSIRIRPYADRSVKNDGSRRDLPIHSAIIRLGFLAYIEHRRRHGQPEDLLFPDGKPNAKGTFGAKLGERFCLLLELRGIVGTKLGTHSFRHNFEDRLRSVRLSGTAVGRALAGRKVEGSEGDYGRGFPVADLREELERVIYPELDLSHLEFPARA